MKAETCPAPTTAFIVSRVRCSEIASKHRFLLKATFSRGKGATVLLRRYFPPLSARSRLLLPITLRASRACETEAENLTAISMSLAVVLIVCILVVGSADEISQLLRSGSIVVVVSVVPPVISTKSVIAGDSIAHEAVELPVRSHRIESVRRSIA